MNRVGIMKYHYEWGIYVHGSCLCTFKEWHLAHACSNDYKNIGTWKDVQVKRTRVYNQ